MTEQISKANSFAIATLVFSVVSAVTMTSLLTGCNPKTETPAASAPKQAAETPAPAPAPQAAAAPEKSATAEKSGESPAKPDSKPEHKTATERHTAKHSSIHKVTEERAPEKKSQAHVCADCGTITAINAVEQEGEGSGLGAIAGGVAGALLGHQVGGGTGKDIATIAGAAGGAYAGHQIEKKMKKIMRYDITVKMENGEHRTISEKEAPAVAVGDKVKIVDGMLQKN